MNLRRLRAFATGRTDNELNPDHVALGRNDFRRTRTFLAPHVFATGGDLPDPPPTELIDRERWEHIVHLADDVALRSSSYSGASMARMSELAYAWLRALPGQPQPRALHARGRAWRFRGVRSDDIHRLARLLPSGARLAPERRRVDDARCGTRGGAGSCPLHRLAGR